MKKTACRYEVNVVCVCAGNRVHFGGVAVHPHISSVSPILTPDSQKPLS